MEELDKSQKSLDEDQKYTEKCLDELKNLVYKEDLENRPKLLRNIKIFEELIVLAFGMMRVENMDDRKFSHTFHVLKPKSPTSNDWEWLCTGTFEKIVEFYKTVDPEEWHYYKIVEAWDMQSEEVQRILSDLTRKT